MNRASYRFGVAWIAMNDNAGNGDAADDVAGYISSALLADLFGVDTARVAKDVMRVRAAEPAPPDEPDDRCSNPDGHVWNRSAGEADEARISGDFANDNIRCVYCGADGDA